jgi:hypothetical protein
MLYFAALGTPIMAVLTWPKLVMKHLEVRRLSKAITKIEKGQNGLWLLN